jgi:hypothetical protein
VAAKRPVRMYVCSLFAGIPFGSGARAKDMLELTLDLL